MIKADDFEIVLARVTFAAHQLLRLDQKPVSFGTFFACIRNRISLSNGLSSFVETTQQQTTTFIRIIANAVLANLG
jgi:hypothetical protein